MSEKSSNIKSIYFPPNCLQGEDIPGHITWREKFFDRIQIEIPKFLKLKEIYNVRPIDYYLYYNKLIIKNCEYGNYIGMLFSSKRAKDPETNVSINLNFFQNNKSILTFKKNIYLFRANLKIIQIPELIKIESNKVTDTIKIGNTGKATVVVYVDSDKISEIEVSEPAKIKTIRDSINKKLKIHFEQVKKDYGEHSELIDDLLEYFIDYDRELRNKIIVSLNKIKDNEEFLKAVAASIAHSIMESMEIGTMVEGFLIYFNSIPAKNILLFNPISVINYSYESAKLNLNILSEDLLGKGFDPILIKPIEIVGDKDGYIEVYKLFSFEDVKEV